MTAIIEQLVSNVLETKFEAFGNELIEDVKERFIDVIGCAIGGASASGNSMLMDLVTGWGGKKEATILVHGNRVPAHYAAMMNSIMCRSYDYETCGPQPGGEGGHRKTGHICGTTDITALTLAELKGSNGKELIAAAILGGDLAARIGIAEDFAYEHSFHYSGTVNAFGATAVAGKLWGLNEQQMLNAFGIVVEEMAGSYQSLWDGVHTFKLTQGTSARNGIVAVELASKGFTGMKDALMSYRGYFAQYCKSYRPELITNDLGKRFYTKGTHKLYPCCYGNHTAIDCCLQLLHQHNINVEDIAEITLGVSQSTYRDYLNQPFEMGASQMKASFNLPYNVANVLMRKSIKLEHFTDEFLRDPKVFELTKKVKLEPTTPHEKRSATEFAVLKVKMRDGREFSAYADEPRGLLGSPLTKEEIKDKFWANVNFSKTVSRKNAEKVLTMLENLEEIDKVSKIVKLLIA